jgi:mannose-6-phosphate isomerase-like protein (cupin superfamily)
MPNLETNPVHLGLGARALVLPAFTGEMSWYADYSAAHVADGAEGRLVSHHSFTESWTSWEMHPAGDEVVICLSGTINLIQEFPDGTTGTALLGAGDYAINGPGVWHTADVDQPCTALFITAGLGTQHRQR